MEYQTYRYSKLVNGKEVAALTATFPLSSRAYGDAVTEMIVDPLASMEDKPGDNSLHCTWRKDGGEVEIFLTPVLTAQQILAADYAVEQKILNDCADAYAAAVIDEIDEEEAQGYDKDMDGVSYSGTCTGRYTGEWITENGQRWYFVIDSQDRPFQTTLPSHC